MSSAYIGPDTLSEKFFASVMVVVGSLVFIVVLASVVAMLTSYDKHNLLHRDYLQTLREFCLTRKLSKSHQRRLMQFVQADWKLNAGFSNSQILSQFPLQVGRFEC